MQISPPGGGPSPTFDEPFEMLHACHGRVQRMLDLTERLREHLRTHGADVQARDAARDVMRYFDLAGPEHHRDEELHVFPALEASHPELVARLRADHRAMEAGWAAARAVLAAVHEGRLASIEGEDAQALDRYALLYRDHLQAEEAVAFPAARAVIPPQREREMGEEMARRRGVRREPA